MPLIIFVRSSILDIWTGSKNRSAMYSSKMYSCNCVCMWFIYHDAREYICTINPLVPGVH